MKCDHSKRHALHIELSKRVFWVAQGLDVTFALRLGRPLGIQLNDIDAELPLDIDDSSISVSGIENTTRLSVDGVPTSMSNAIHVIRLRIIWAKIHSLVYSGTVLKDTDNENHRASIIQLREDLEQWRSRMPELRPRRGKTLSIFLTKAWYELNYYGSILLLYRPQLAEDKNTPDKIFIDCMEAASYICREYRRQYIGTDVKPTWSSLHFLFLAGLTYLHCLWSSSVASRSVRQSEVNKTCNDCTMVLVVIAEMWKGAAPYRDIFETLASHTVSMIINRSLSFNLPEGPALADPLDREAVTGWISDIDDMGMLDVFDDMLAGFVNDIGPYDDIAQFET
ncbi:uncharacterized protein N7469_002491 [Penicillium citrinum]|uniref:Xylanolytic transcriptional activator regulatory domain-containing protein n=1 Tax=Penicillium citrinum TaxID=5077 RepID=A0A9W9PAR3_PENCI|nr:uncharacterized protein N7469_002491 [Penicillium citrinum]KAJ5240900.1 hypothetical protein N7469_002491 [Penicillium citrinum]